MKWETLKSEYVVNDKWLKVRADKCIMPNEKIIEPYYVLEYPNWVNIVPVTVDEKVILVKSYRHGIGKILLELPCGLIDNTDQSPLDAARRELLEETGYTSCNFIETGIVSPNPANHNNFTYCFLAQDLKLVKKPELDETEELEIVLVSLDKTFEMLKKGEFLQALHVSSLFYAESYLC
ncbi:MAG TPA: NUDIX hydrolase [Victivallales bacterium]|nr:NUDIX hydrolase [Victivallales bacterium]